MIIVSFCIICWIKPIYFLVDNGVDAETVPVTTVYTMHV